MTHWRKLKKSAQSTGMKNMEIGFKIYNEAVILLHFLKNVSC
jgi:hypothetical protein